MDLQLRPSAGGKLVPFLLLGIIFFCFPLSWAQGQDYPSKPIEVVVSYEPGGVVDICTRVIVDGMSRELKEPLIIKNIAGASGMIGSSAVLKAKPDGYTLLSTSSAAMITSPLQSPNPPYDPFKDFLPIGIHGSSPMMFGVEKSSPFKTMAEFVDYAKKNSGKLIVGVTQFAGENHLNLEIFKRAAGINLKTIPYQGTGLAVSALLGKHIDMLCLSYVAFVPYIKSSQARALAVTERIPNFSAPSIAEAGYPQVKMYMLVGFFVSSKVPPQIHQKLVSVFEKVIKEPETAKRLEASGILCVYKKPGEFMSDLKERTEITSKLIDELGWREK